MANNYLLGDSVQNCQETNYPDPIIFVACLRQTKSIDLHNNFHANKITLLYSFSKIINAVFYPHSFLTFTKYRLSASKIPSKTFRQRALADFILKFRLETLKYLKTKMPSETYNHSHFSFCSFHSQMNLVSSPATLNYRICRLNH